MAKLLALLRVFRRGEQVADPAAWKNGQITVNGLTALVLALVGLARAFGVPLEVNDAEAMAMGGGLLALGNVLLTAATSRKVGLPPVDGDAAGSLGAGSS